MERERSTEVVSETELHQECVDELKVSVGKRIATKVRAHKVRTLKQPDERALASQLRNSNRPEDPRAGTPMTSARASVVDTTTKASVSSR